MNRKSPRYGLPGAPAASLFRLPVRGSEGRMGSRLSPAEERFYELPSPPGEGRYFWDEGGNIVVWYSRHARREDVERARARLDHRVVVSGD